MYSSNADNAMFSGKGDRIPSCGLPVTVFSRSSACVVTPDFKNAFTVSYDRHRLHSTPDYRTPAAVHAQWQERVALAA